MCHNYNTPPPFTFNHMRFAMCTQHYIIYTTMHSDLQALDNPDIPKDVLKFSMANLRLIPIDLVTSSNWVPVNTDLATPHTCETTCLTASSLVCRCAPCYHTPRRYILSCKKPTILAKINWVANPHHPKPQCR
jgi:hypothetical protein